MRTVEYLSRNYIISRNFGPNIRPYASKYLCSPEQKIFKYAFPICLNHILVNFLALLLIFSPMHLTKPDFNIILAQNWLQNTSWTWKKWDYTISLAQRAPWVSWMNHKLIKVLLKKWSEFYFAKFLDGWDPTGFPWAGGPPEFFPAWDHRARAVASFRVERGRLARVSQLFQNAEKWDANPTGAVAYTRKEFCPQ